MATAIALSPARPTQTERAEAHTKIEVDAAPLDALDQTATDAWRGLIEDDPQARIDVYPECVSLADDVTIVRAWQAAESSRTLIGLAALVREEFDLSHHLLPVGRTRLPGFRLAGNQILHGNDSAALASLVDALADQMLSAKAELLEVEDVAPSSPLWRELQRLTKRGFHCCTPIPLQPHHRIRLPDSADKYWATFTSKARSELRRRKKKLGETRLKRYTSAGQIDEFLAEAQAVSVNSWQGRQRGVGVASTDEQRRYLQFLTALDAWRSYVLYRDERPIAYALGYQLGGAYHYDRPGYDSEFAGLAPGKMLLVEILNDLFKEDCPHTFDFGPGHLDYKGFFSNETTQTATLWLLPPGGRGSWVATSLGVRRALSAGLRRALHRTGLHALAHRIHRRGWRMLLPKAS